MDLSGSILKARLRTTTASAVRDTLLRAENAAGFKNVNPSNSATKPFQAQLQVGGRKNHLGYFVTAEEAALAVARFCAAREASPAQEPAMMAVEAEEGLPPRKRARPG